MVSDDSQPVDIMLELPEILENPVLMPSGEYLSIGEYVEHQDFGIGRVTRIATYHDDQGIIIRVEYPDSKHRTLSLKCLQKVQAAT